MLPECREGEFPLVFAGELCFSGREEANRFAGETDSLEKVCRERRRTLRPRGHGRGQESPEAAGVVEVNLFKVGPSRLGLDNEFPHEWGE